MKRTLLACATALSLITAAQAEVKVGAALGITGPVAAAMPRIQNAINLAIKNINEQGGLFKDGEKLELFVGDSQCDPVTAVDAVKKLVDVNQVVGFVGPICSGATIAQAQSVSIPAGVVSIAISATSPEITTLEKDTDVLFRVVPSDSFQGIAIADIALKKGMKELAVMYSQDDYNAAISKVFMEAYKKKGGKITAVQAFDPGKSSYRSQVATLGKDTNNMALFAYYGNGGIVIMRDGLETGTFDTFVGGDSMRNDEVIKQLGAENLKNVTFTSSASDQSSEGYKKWEKLAVAANIIPGEPFTPNSYDAMFMLALAIEKAGSKDRTKISKALREIANAPGEIIHPGEWAKAKKILESGGDIHYIGGSGKVDFDKFGDVDGLYSANTVSKDGKWVAEILK